MSRVKELATAPFGFSRGFGYPLRGMRFVYKEHRGLVRYWIFPVLITLVALVGAIWGALHIHSDVVTVVWGLIPDSWTEGDGWLASILGFFRGFIGFLIAVVSIVVAVMLVAVCSSLIAAPFNDALSEAVERITTGGAAPPFRIKRLVADLGRTLSMEGLKLILYMAVMIPLFLVSLFVPVIGQLVSVLGFALTALYLAFDYIDWPAARREQPIADRIRLVRRRLATMLGFGTGVWCFLLIPFVNLLFMPAAVAGGTLLYLDIEARDARKMNRSTQGFVYGAPLSGG